MNMADDGASSHNQKLKSNATTVANQIRMANAHDAGENPSGRKASWIVIVKMASHQFDAEQFDAIGIVQTLDGTA